jgi:hypothetical protein
MSRITLSGNASGTGNFTLASPNSNTDRTLTLPDATGTVVLADATQTLTNKSIAATQLTGALPALDASALTNLPAANLTGDVAAARITGALNASGSAPIYACRAWVNFNGTGTVAIRASGNVSSITDNGTGEYTVNFATALPDANYCALVSVATDSSGYTAMISAASIGGPASVKTASTLQIRFRAGSTFADAAELNVAVFR